jgi:primosomal protein N' (replication factor Y)
MLITAKILLPLIFDNEFDYLIPPNKDFEIGDFVEVPFSNKRIIGVITSFSDEVDEKIKSKLKYIICAVREKDFNISPLSKDFLEFIKKQSEYYLQPKGLVLGLCYSQKFFTKPKRKTKDTSIKKLHKNIVTFSLNEEQKRAYENISNRLCQNKFSVTVLDGVTGSGKTEVFFNLAEDELNKGNQVLIMLPEIFLTSQIVNRFEARFKNEAVIWHSAISDSKKRKYFFDIANGEAKIVIGARSALHLPYKNLSLIICDEEHDASYKQDESVIYNARDMAVLRAKIENISVVLSSATPSLETVNNINEGKYFIEKLTARYSDIKMPKINVIDMRKEKLNSEQFISESLKMSVEKTLKAGFQAMFYLNRRGYAPIVICGNCGFRFKSPDTSAWLVLHYDKSRQAYLQCHHSGYKIPMPKNCPACNAEESFRACGPGTQRIYEEAKMLFPNARIIEMSSDSLTSKKKVDEILQKIINHEIDIIIGTQVIAKGHHFPKLKLVGVVDADLGLDFVDLRASEKTFQILQQVSGRAGREKEEGEVYMQSYCPENAVIIATKNYDREGFIKYEMNERKLGFLPPFSKLVAIIVSSTDNIEAQKFAKLVVSNLIQTKDVKILGPAEAMYFELRGWFRYRILLKCEKTYNIQNYIKKSFENLKIPKNTKLKIDVDPYNFS